MESRHIPPQITTADDLPARYPTGGGMYYPRQDWRYIQAGHTALRGGVFLDGGTITNMEHARQRLVRAGLMQDHTKGETDGEDD